MPLPRRPDRGAAGARRAAARRRSRAAARCSSACEADVVVGFGGYVAVPAYLAARRRQHPDRGARGQRPAGLANRLAARLTTHVFTASPDAGCRTPTPIGIPLRPAIADLDRAALRAEARARFGLDPDRPTLLVTGGSQGARPINRAVAGGRAGAARRRRAGAAHHRARRTSLDGRPTARRRPYVVVPYVERDGVRLRRGRPRAVPVRAR